MVDISSRSLPLLWLLYVYICLLSVVTVCSNSHIHLMKIQRLDLSCYRFVSYWLPSVREEICSSVSRSMRNYHGLLWPAWNSRMPNGIAIQWFILVALCPKKDNSLPTSFICLCSPMRLSFIPSVSISKQDRHFLLQTTLLLKLRRTLAPWIWMWLRIYESLETHRLFILKYSNCLIRSRWVEEGTSSCVFL